MDRALEKVAGRFVQFIHGSTGLPLIVCDEQGVIRQSSDPRRVGTRHAVAARIMAGESDELFVTAEDVARDPRMKEGCNRAIVIGDARLGTFGIAGPVALARPLVRVATAIVAAWIKDQRKEDELAGAADAVLAGVRRIAERAQALEAEADEVGRHMAAASAAAAAKVGRSMDTIRGVQEIARTSRILSINGTVEAARAGEQGRGFAVVAAEMLGLAEKARGSSAEIEGILQDVERSMKGLAEAIERSTALAREDRAALAEVKQVVEDLRATMTRLTAS